MKKVIFLMLLSFNIQASDFDVYLFGGFFAYNDDRTKYDYNGLSPNGYFGVKVKYKMTNRLSLDGGLKHESSTGYREHGEGFNGVFTELNLKIN